ncbi:hypothetical protein [Streptomyces violaceusniger]|uniref:hypothetical protein n=1 Tax=Streptomyces violaceusniger TaxID=68280 RepID=UPI0036BA97C3
MRLGHLQPLYDCPDESAAQERERAARQAIRRLAGQGADRATCRAVRRPYEGGAD